MMFDRKMTERKNIQSLSQLWNFLYGQRFDRKMTESNTIQLWNGVQDDNIDTQEQDDNIDTQEQYHKDRKSLKSFPAKSRLGFLKKVDLTGCSKLNKLPQILVILSSACTPPLQIEYSTTLSTSQPNSQLRDRWHRTRLLTREAEVGSTSPPRSPSYLSSPPRSPSWAQPRPPHQLLEWIFVITNFVLEIASAVFDQLSSARKPQYALVGMLMSIVALVICIVELVYTCRKQKVVWRWKGTLPWPWFYYPLRGRPFGNFKDITGLVCALCQCIFTAINYGFARQHADSPLKVCFWPMVFAFGLLCSKCLAR